MKTLLAGLLLLCTCTSLLAEDKTIEPSQTWKGSIDDETLRAKAPAVITSQEAWDAVWADWKIEGKAPKVDFAKEFVVVQTTSGSRLTLTARLTEAGDLKAFAFGTRDFRPGFRYVLGSFSREGVKTINGEPLEAEKPAEKVDEKPADAPK